MSQQPDWSKIAADPGFKELQRAKRRFIIPATIFFIVFYFALPVLVGYQPELMEKRVWRTLNWAYLFALSQFIMAWVLAWMYVRASAKWDRMSHDLLRRLGHE